MDNIEVRGRHGGPLHSSSLKILRSESDVEQAISTATGGDKISEVQVATHLRSPAVMGCMPGIDGKLLWASNVWAAWRGDMWKDLAVIDNSEEDEVHRQVGWVRCQPGYDAVMPGQILVFYAGDLCLGRGRIIAASWGC